VLSFFGGNSNSKKNYSWYVENGIDQGRRPELVGGGLIRSMGGWSEVLASRRRGEERRLTSGYSVIEVRDMNPLTMQLTGGIITKTKCGIVQFQLVHIHPFLDGNGRASRLLSTLCLYKAGYDFKRLFTISEYYDRDRPAFYKSIQSVRDNGMDLTVWLDYFVTGLETQMIEVKQRGEQVIRRDVLVQKHGLNKRQGRALEFLMQHGKLTIQDFETICPDVNRRSLQRDLKGLLDKELINEVGAGATDPTRHYVMAKL
jgi:hypothetical protein